MFRSSKPTWHICLDPREMFIVRDVRCRTLDVGGHQDDAWGDTAAILRREAVVSGRGGAQTRDSRMMKGGIQRWNVEITVTK